MHSNVEVVAENKEDLQTILDKPNIKINPKETRILVYSRNNNARTKISTRKTKKNRTNRQDNVLGKYYK